MIGIYMYTDKDNGKRYIGQSTNIIKRRASHKSQSRTPFDKILKLKGENSFIFEVLEICTPEELDEREIYWIEYYNSFFDGYNCNPGGSVVRGEHASNATISNKTAKQIINDLATTKDSFLALAEKYNCSRDVISSINNCRGWTFLHNYENNIRYESGMSLKKGPVRLSINEICEIIRLLSETTENIQDIAKQFNVSRGIIGQINNCHKYTELHNFKENIRKEGFKRNNIDKLNPKSNLTEKQVLNIIYQLEHSDKSIVNLAKELNISEGIIQGINSCYCFTYLHNYKENIRLEYYEQHPEQKPKNNKTHLTEKQILDIIKLLETTNYTYVEIGKQFNVTDSTISRINHCQGHTNLHSYKHNIRKEAQNIDKEPFERLCENQVLQIINLLETTTLSQNDIAKQFKVCRATVGNINCCKNWTYLHNYKNNIRQEAKLTNK